MKIILTILITILKTIELILHIPTLTVNLVFTSRLEYLRTYLIISKRGKTSLLRRIKRIQAYHRLQNKKERARKNRLELIESISYTLRNESS